MSKLDLQNLWASRITDYKASGQSVKDWCADNNIKPSQLWYRLRKERQDSSKTTSSWLPVDLSEAGLQNSLLVRVGRVAVEVRPGFEPKLLVDVVNTLIAK